MRIFANSSLLLSLSSVALLTPKCSVQAHFLFAKLDDNEQGVKIFFSEPAAMEGKAIQYVGNRVNKLTMIGPSFKSNGDTHSIDMKMDTDDAGYLSGALPTEKKLDNTPYFITGFLDYGDFGEGDGPKKDLQYTYSIQISSTNPSDDFSHFFHYVAGTDAVSPYRDFFTDVDDSNTEDPFAIALNNYGPPYRVVMRGVGESTPVRVCLYEGYGSNRKVGCVEGTHNRTHHLTFDAELFGVLNPCETYYALGNTTEIDEVTGKVKSLWSSTSITWNGPCRMVGVEPRAPVPQWYESTHFRDHHSSTTETTSTSPIMDPSVTKSLLFTGGFLAGVFLYHIMMQYAKYCQKQNNGAHFNVVSTDEKTECCSDDDMSSTQQMT